MRRILMFMGIVLLAFPLVAQGAVKVRSRTAGYPRWDIPPGAKFSKGFKAPVKAGPFTLGFHTQIEMDFNSNHQIDFSEEVADGQVNNGVAGANAAVVPPPLGTFVTLKNSRVAGSNPTNWLGSDPVSTNQSLSSESTAIP